MITKDAKSVHLHSNIDFKIFDNFQEEVVIYEIINDILDKIGDLRVKYVNGASINSDIFLSNEIIGKTVTELFDKDTSSLHVKMANEALESGKGKKYKIYFKDLDKFYLISAYLPSENIYITINTDITKLKKEEKKTEKAIENIALAYFELDDDWRFIDANSKIEYIMKRERDDLIGNIIWEEFPYLVDTEYYIQYHKAKEENNDVHFEIRSKHNGEWYEVHAHPHQQGLTVCFHNIDERKKVEKELIEQIGKFKEDLKVSNRELQTTNQELSSAKEELHIQGDKLINLSQDLLKIEAQYKSLAKNLPSVLVKYDKDLRVLYLSPNAKEITGIYNNEFIGRTVREVGMPEYLCDLWENNISEVFQTGEIKDLEFDFPSAEGSRTFYLRLAPELDQNEKINHVLGIYTDITSYKKVEKQKELLDQIKVLNADLENSNKELNVSDKELKISKELLEVSNKELHANSHDLQIANEELHQQREKLKDLNKKLQESEAQYKSLAENLPAVIMRYDRDFRVVYLSPNSMHATDISTEQFIGKTSRELGIPEEICNKWETTIEKVFQTGKNQEVEFEFPSADGSYPKTFYFKFTPELDGESIKYVLGISTEITELKNTQRKLKEVQDALDEKS